MDADLTGGKPFQTVATQYSIDPKVRQTQGIIEIPDLSRAPAGLQQLIDSTPEGKTTAWQPQPEGFAKVYVEQKVKSKPMTLDANQKELLRRQLAQQRGSAASDLPKRLLDKLRASKITVSDPTLRANWDVAFKAILAQGTPSAPAAVPGAAPTSPNAVPPTAAPGPGRPPAAGKG